MESIEFDGVLFYYCYKPYGDDFITAEWWRTGDQARQELDCGFRTEAEVDRQIARDIQSRYKRSA